MATTTETSTITIKIDKDLLKQIEERAAKENQTTDEVANELLRNSLRPYKLELEGWPAKLRPGVDLTDREKLYDLMEGTDLAEKYGR